MAGRKPKNQRFVRCPSCHGVRLHTLKIRTDEATGRKSRVWVCSTDGTSRPDGGMCCWACGHNRFWLETIRHKRPGKETRVKACRKCGTRYRTGEAIEALA